MNRRKAWAYTQICRIINRQLTHMLHKLDTIKLGVDSRARRLVVNEKFCGGSRACQFFTPHRVGRDK